MGGWGWVMVIFLVIHYIFGEYVVRKKIFVLVFLFLEPFPDHTNTSHQHSFQLPPISKGKKKRGRGEAFTVES